MNYSWTYVFDERSSCYPAYGPAYFMKKLMSGPVDFMGKLLMITFISNTSSSKPYWGTVMIYFHERTSDSDSTGDYLVGHTVGSFYA